MKEKSCWWICFKEFDRVSFLHFFRMNLLEMNRFVFACFLGACVLAGCETEAQRKERLERVAEENRQRALREQQMRQEAAERARKQAAEKARLQREREERERKAREEQQRRAKWMANHLDNGAQPFTQCWGWNRSCEDWGCSEIKVVADRNYDVLLTLKEDNEDGDVARHVYIRRGQTKSVQVPNGTYQPFFIYGKGWDPNAVNPISGCSKRGWFVEQLEISKDFPDYLSNTAVTYRLQVTVGGNFQTKRSNASEAL